MSDRVRELAERQAELQLRCEMQRAVVANEFAALERRFDSVDRAVGAARRVLLHPATIVAGVVALLTIGRVGGFRLLGRAVVLGASARRLLLTVRGLGGSGASRTS
jgi:hypothetical protein